MNDLIVPVGLVALGVLLIALEAFIPSAGVLGVLAALSLFAGVITAFLYGGLTIGTAFFIATFFGVGMLISYMVRRWPQTTFGKLILVEPPPPDELLPDRNEVTAMIGRYGQVLSLMVPSGLVEIDGKRYEASADSAVEPGTWVEVVSVRHGRNLIVRPVPEEVVLTTENRDDTATEPLGQAVDGIVDPFNEN